VAPAVGRCGGGSPEAARRYAVWTRGNGRRPGRSGCEPCESPAREVRPGRHGRPVARGLGRERAPGGVPVAVADVRARGPARGVCVRWRSRCGGRRSGSWACAGSVRPVAFPLRCPCCPGAQGRRMLTSATEWLTSACGICATKAGISSIARGAGRASHGHARRQACGRTTTARTAQSDRPRRSSRDGVVCLPLIRVRSGRSACAQVDRRALRLARSDGSLRRVGTGRQPTRAVLEIAQT
jgi:hypothetical protein